MQITLVQGLLIALLVFICAIDKHMETFMWFRPLVVAFFTGIILGDVQLGMQAGAVAEVSYLGLLTVGGTVPPDPLFAGLMTTVLAYTTGCDDETRSLVAEEMELCLHTVVWQCFYIRNPSVNHV